MAIKEKAIVEAIRDLIDSDLVEVFRYDKAVFPCHDSFCCYVAGTVDCLDLLLICHGDSPQ